MHPLVTICYNNHAYVASTLAQAGRFGLVPMVVDNASTYVATQRFLREIEERGTHVVRLTRNEGPQAWLLPQVYDKLPSRFFLTDPDLQWNVLLPREFPDQLDDLCTRHNARKVGFALDIRDAALMFQDADYFGGGSIAQWEQPNWRRRLPDPHLELFVAGIDTTFHLFNKACPKGPELRVAGDFTARHLPWYRTTAISPHDRLHMYAASRESTIAKLVLREMIREGSLRSAFATCRAICGASAITVSAVDIEVQLGRL